ncbi:PREDICTED: uncharacterized protein LOC104810784 [Tarenaya hassleriana]|uniref:uncharacterized protein LOC104810784 n=1 Tax=Tarenaya hassleriana TaxID=28532 RepID=UPI00053C3783|nr:PREDICTED: uncharacterized protein LOC104810784 [Tarenaya hassleriana]
MPNAEIFLPKKEFDSEESESLAVFSTPQDPDSSPRDQNLSGGPSKRSQSGQGQEQDKEHEELRDRTRRKRKREGECGVSPLQIPVTSVVETSPAGEYSGEGYKTSEEMNPSSLVDVEVRNPRRSRDPPPAPRKPKAAPAMKQFRSSLVLLDVSREVESMFPLSVLQDFCEKIRKAGS